jgi:transglutaminase-like putative cysteine protease
MPSTLPPHRVVELPFDGPRFTKWTLDQMEKLTLAGCRDLALVDLAGEIAMESAAARDTLGQAAGLLQWVRETVYYLPDPVGVELVREPGALISRGAGDCDDMSVLLAALASCIGIPVRFVAIATTPEGFDHVYPELWIDALDAWLPADAAVPGVPIGWSAPAVQRMVQDGRS